MEKSILKLLKGYQSFREKYALGDRSIMQNLSYHGQKPEIMIIACCDARVDPALILQCDPGDLFVVRNVANLVPPYEVDDTHHGTSAALEFGVRFLGIKHLILLGHSQCGGIQALLEGSTNANKNDFIFNWVSLVKIKPTPPFLDIKNNHPDDYAKLALNQSYQNCLSFPWIKDKVDEKKLMIHSWFFDIQKGEIFNYDANDEQYHPLA